MRKVLLCILDGFGYTPKIFGNATLEASFITSFFGKSNCAFLNASGAAVGLPHNQFGNSEVGHMTIGAGRILPQKIVQINEAIESKALKNNTEFLQFLGNIKNNTCHLMCLFSNGGVHSHLQHFFWAVEFLRNRKIDIRAHLFLDGRDVAYNSALSILQLALLDEKIKLSEIATIQGRFYAMDRDNRMDRTEAAYQLIAEGKGLQTSDPLATIQNFYEKNIYDEMMHQICLENYFGAKPDDSFWMLNFRIDRIKQIIKMLQIHGKNFRIMNMFSCGSDIDLNSTVLFQNYEIKNTLGEVLAKNEIKQLRIAETEKYAHVTYFFNGGKDVQYPGEDRIIIQSPDVKDYALTPDMSSALIIDAIQKAIEFDNYEVIIANFSSPDMIGHTGNFEVAKKAIHMLDQHIKYIVDIAQKSGFAVILTADHGNAEEMIDDNMNPQKSHTNNPIPLILFANKLLCKKYGKLSDVAPTILDFLQIIVPKEMSGVSFLNCSSILSKEPS